ncbi:MAG: RimK family alpha-L-glutamate ligase [Planctomycetota bacterium]|nr:RimK family alpha-L-glutamate ligase [Planctomycetota bacterium]
MRLGVLGSPTGWYMRDLQRAAEALPDNRATSIDSLSFAKLSVWSQQTETPHANSWTQSTDESTKPESTKLSDYDAVLVRTMPLGSVEQIVFRMNALHVALSAGVQILNPPRCLEIAIDKWLTLDIARQSGIETPRTICCQTREDALLAFEMLGRDCIVKPIFGGEGRGIVRVTDADMAWRVFSTLEQLQSVIYIQEFLVSQGYDLRLLVVGDELFCVRRENHGDWRSNVARGGQAIPHEPTFEQISIAFRACKAIQGWMIGVDILPTMDGRNVLLEVNAVPGWRATAAALNVDMAQLVLNRLHDRSDV